MYDVTPPPTCFVLEKIEMKNNFYENDIFIEIYFICMM